jgi:hypothetical protein
LLQVSLRPVNYAWTMRYLLLTPLLWLAACDGTVYTRDGVTDGDTFYLAPRAWTDDDPVLQSWVAYSLMKSACQLEVGGENPARVSDYGCEFTARRHLVEAWEEHRAGASDPYLDDLLAVRDAGFLDEYTVFYFGHSGWAVPGEVRVADFRRWRKSHLQGHRPQTRLIGSWNYRAL